jgi:hypothetical protein
MAFPERGNEPPPRSPSAHMAAAAAARRMCRLFMAPILNYAAGDCFMKLVGRAALIVASLAAFLGAQEQSGPARLNRCTFITST